MTTAPLGIASVASAAWSVPAPTNRSNWAATPNAATVKPTATARPRIVAAIRLSRARSERRANTSTADAAGEWSTRSVWDAAAEYVVRPPETREQSQRPGV